MSIFVKNRSLLLTTIGLVVMIQSVLWEYVRVEPEYGFIVEPWALRGFEVTQGVVIAVSAAVILAIVAMTMLGIIKETFIHGVILIAATTAYAVVAALLATDQKVRPSAMLAVLLSILGANAVDTIVHRYIPNTLKDTVRRTVRVGGWLVGVVVLFIAVFGPLFSGNEVPAWTVILATFVLFDVIVLMRQPQELTAHRTIINGVVVVWMVAMTSASALRAALQTEQIAVQTTGGVPDIQALQVTSGLMWAWLGGLIAFSGAVGLWASRRDQIAAHERAIKQREAAAESEQQLSNTL